MEMGIVGKRQTMVAEALLGPISAMLVQKGVRVIHGVDNGAVLRKTSQVLLSDSFSVTEIKKIRVGYPNVSIGLADPKARSRDDIAVLQAVDFAVTSSFEHRAMILKYGTPAVNVIWRPNLQNYSKAADPSPSSVTPTLFYHGNRVHLESFSKRGLRTLERLSKEVDFIFEAHYPMLREGRWSKPGWLKSTKVIEENWSSDVVWSRLSQSDIGVVPNLLTSKAIRPMLEVPLLGRRFLNKEALRRDDWLLRLKVTSNPGRIIPFGHFGIPVVADFFPSSALMIRHGVDGLLALNQEQWEENLRLLLTDKIARASLGNSLKNRIADNFHERHDAEKLLGFLHDRFQLSV